MSPTRRRYRSSLVARGEPMLWLTASSLVLSVLMISLLLVWIAWQGFGTFWPLPLERFTLADGTRVMGEVTRTERFAPSAETLASLDPAVRARAAALVDSDGLVGRRLVRTANYELSGDDENNRFHFRWIEDYLVVGQDRPQWALAIERLEWGRFFGEPRAYVHVNPTAADDPATARGQLAALAERAPPAGAEYRALVERWVEDDEREVLVAIDQVADDDVVLGLAEVWTGPAMAWQRFGEHHDEVRSLWERKQELERDDLGEVAEREEEARLALREAQLRYEPPEAWVAAYLDLRDAQRAGDTAAIDALSRRLAVIEEDFGRPPEEFLQVVAEVERIEKQAAEDAVPIIEAIAGLEREAKRHRLLMAPVAGDPVLIAVKDIVRAYPANQLGVFGKTGVYLSRWGEFLSDDPRESNFEGGVFPAIFGTVLMTMIMCLLVVPFGVLAALYLREYAKGGLVTSVVRIAVNNLAGVPSIVFGVFGVGFFCYIVGVEIDELLFRARLPESTFGTGGLLWASLTLSLLTLPVVIVATEEALAAVPNSMREGSYACGASKWQTIRRIVLPRAMPGILTGAILAMARGAGEVAPLMLVGAVKLAPKLPVDTEFPFGIQRKFMHLGFHIYDLGFQSQNSEAAEGMVYTTTRLLIGIIATLNIAAIWLRTRLHRKFTGSHF